MVVTAAIGEALVFFVFKKEHTVVTWHDGEREVLGFWACSFILKNIRTITDWHSRLQRDKAATNEHRSASACASTAHLWPDGVALVRGGGAGARD